MLPAVLNACDAARDAALERLFTFLRIPSISTDPAYAGEVKRCAEHIAADLAAIGLDVAVYPTEGHPMVVAKSRESHASGPHVLFYGHYDVQPVDPLDLWETDPFDPRIVERRDGTAKIVARGSSDDKGQVMTFVEACRAWIEATGKLPVPVTILLEGEEESGSPSLDGFFKAHGDVIAADFALVCDTSQWDAETPAIATTLRGLVGEEVTITCADKDLHSGSFGGAARNPIQLLAKILASLHDDDGRVTLPGFYDGVPEISDALRAMWDGLDFSESDFLGEVGLSIPAGETGRSVLEKIWARPTCEVNGITGGYTGKGFKTVLPSKASAKVSFRLVGTQDPLAIRKAFRAHVEAMLPADCKVEFHEHGASPATVLDVSGEGVSKARQALEEEWGRPAVLVGMGGSIPIVGAFKRRFGLDSVMVGYALDNDQIHSPNEKYELASFIKGTRSWARILGAYGNLS
ncbi:MAG: M20/M25/M40 family metallo-hydrolase [Hyphomicrobiaceae bacterium]|nr:M20/M25/M40 family metallo-hydrolase [Hyphomicrobiaceae bacterium]